MAEKLGANQDQVEGTARASNVAGGFSLTHGQSRTGKSTIVVLQALTAATMGHRVLVGVPESAADDELRDLFGSLMQKTLNKTRIKICQAAHLSDDD